MHPTINVTRKDATCASINRLNHIFRGIATTARDMARITTSRIGPNARYVTISTMPIIRSASLSWSANALFMMYKITLFGYIHTGKTKT
jgi:hypothetical protein